MKAGGASVADQADFERALLGKTSGDKIEVVVKRDGSTEKLNLTIAGLGNQKFVQNSKKNISLQNSTTVVRGSSPESTDEKSWRVLGLKLNTITGKSQQITGTQVPRWHASVASSCQQPCCPKRYSQRRHISWLARLGNHQQREHRLRSRSFQT